jgi:predicted P-loop ATPase
VNLRLSDEDYRSLESCYISREYAESAGIYRVDSSEGRERVGRSNGAGEYEGLLFPYRDPVARRVVGERLRLDHPPVDHKGKPLHKYLSPPGQRNHFYWPLADQAWLDDHTLPVLITEGEKKYLAAQRAAFENAKNSRPLFFAIAIAGVYAWKGVIGATSNKTGKRVPVKGVIPDFDKVKWDGRTVIIAFDANALTNDQVNRARGQLARELAARGAEVYFLELPPKTETGVDVNGIDDYLAAAGLEKFLELYRDAQRWDWHSGLQKTEKGKIKANVAGHAAIALRFAPEFRDVLVWNQFAERPEIRRPPPWKSPPGLWKDIDDIHLREWLEGHGIIESRANVMDAVALVASESPYHPVRDYLESLEWDGVGRLSHWLTTYVGAPDTKLNRAIGSKWMIAAVARIMDPGCKADHIPIFEGPQGIGKSRLVETLAGDFGTDDMPDLTSKDAQIALAGIWIVEFSELDSLNRAEASRIKSFLSRRVDRYRPPYGRRMEEHPRQCSFAGTANKCDYGNDETGLRRYWPVVCGNIDLEALQRDRDQLWAEARERCRNGETWWLEDADVIADAQVEQEARQRDDLWDQYIAGWLNSHPEPVSTADVLVGAIKKDVNKLERADRTRVGPILTRLGRVKRHLWVNGVRQWMYCEKEEEK